MPSLVQYHIGRLRDKNPKVRAESAYQLGLLGDLAALDALEAMYRVESDPDVKVVIQDAGRRLYKKKKQEDSGQS